MIRHKGIFAVATLVLIFLGRAAQADANEDLLKSKGLTKVGLLYLLQEDIKLPEDLRSMRADKHRIDENAARRNELEKQIDAAAQVVYESEMEVVSLADRRDKLRKNETVRFTKFNAEIRELLLRKSQALRSLTACQKEIEKLPDPSNDYIASVQGVSSKMEATLKKYDALTAESQIKDAISNLSAGQHAKMALGPSEAFKQALTEVRQARAMVDARVIKLEISDGGVPCVNVLLNGKENVEMVFDSGASYVMLNDATARKLGLKPGKNDPVIYSVTADGKATQVKLMMLKSVRLGQFVVENVACMVSPASVKSPNLLGGTFLKNFVFRVDLGARQIHMSQMSGQPAEAMRVAVGPNPPQAAGAPKVDDGWTILFRASDPSLWNTDSNNPDAYAAPLAKAPRNMRFLRMRDEKGHTVIIRLSAESLAAHVIGDKFGWEGTKLDKNSALHLGIVARSMKRKKTGSVDLVEQSGIGWTGYGFGNRVNKNDAQGYVWAGKPSDRTVFEIAVTSRDLTPVEAEKLLTN